MSQHLIYLVEIKESNTIRIEEKKRIKWRKLELNIIIAGEQES